MAKYSTLCDYPDCTERIHYSASYIPGLITCFCRTLKKNFCPTHCRGNTTICTKCVTGSVNRDNEYICHMNSAIGKNVWFLKITKDVYIMHHRHEVVQSKNKQKILHSWSVHRRTVGDIFARTPIYTADLKPYTYIPILEYDLKKMNNNYANVLPNDIIGIISKYLFNEYSQI